MVVIKFIGGFILGIGFSMLLEVVLFQQFIDKILYNSGFPVSNLVDSIRLVAVFLLIIFLLNKIKELKGAFLYGYILSSGLLTLLYIWLLNSLII